MATFVLVHGAWQGGWTWSRVAPLLRASGHDVHVPTLTGVGERAHLLSRSTGLETHIRDVTQLLDFERLEHAVLVGHSYGGQVIAGAATDRPERIGRLVYLDAFVPHDGASATELQPSTIAEHYRESVEQRGFGWLIPPRALDVLGVTDPSDVDWLSARMLPHPYKTFTDAARDSDRSLDVPSAFVECVDWMRVFTPMREVAEQRGWDVRELRTGHQPMTTAPIALARALNDLAA
jgi:pimeloyl-ACP methyl ester carboxylesterase